MKILNENGVKKLNDYIRSTYGDVLQIHENKLFGSISDKASTELKNHGITFEEVEPGISYRVIVEDTPVSTIAPLETTKSAVTPSTTNVDYEDEKKMKELISRIIPHLNNHFPTKEEVNNALNDLRGQLIDPEKLQSLFKNVSNDIKKTEEKKV